MNIGGEALIFDTEGTPVYGLTGGTVYSSDYYKNNYPLKKIKPGTKLDFWIEGAANSLFGLLRERRSLNSTGSAEGAYSQLSSIACGWIAPFTREANVFARIR